MGLTDVFKNYKSKINGSSKEIIYKGILRSKAEYLNDEIKELLNNCDNLTKEQQADLKQYVTVFCFYQDEIKKPTFHPIAKKSTDDIYCYLVEHVKKLPKVPDCKKRS